MKQRQTCKEMGHVYKWLRGPRKRRLPKNWDMSPSSSEVPATDGCRTVAYIHLESNACDLHSTITQKQRA